MSTKLIRHKILIAAAAAAVVGTTVPAHAGLFGHSKKWKEAQAAAAAQAAADEQARQDAIRAQQEAAQRAYQQQLEAQRQAEAQQEALRQQQQAAWEAQQRAAIQAAQAQAQAAQQPQVVQQQPVVNNGAVNAGGVDKNGVPLLGPDGQPLSDKDKALWPFRHQQLQNMPVVITQSAWTPAIEDQFSQFVAKFGAGVKAKPMRRLNFYMHDIGTNPYAGGELPGVYYYSDCADLPYFLRSYFAYKNGLPMSIAAGAVMNMHPFASQSSPGYDNWSATHSDRTDVSPYGNSLSSRAASNIPSAPGREKNYIQYWGILMDAGSTRTFMVSPFTPNYNLSDVYPVTLDRNGIRAGTLVHSDGHMLIVTSVHANGDVELIDAHPDNSLQFKTLDPSKLMRDRPDRAYGFFRFRPTHTVGGSTYTTSSGQQAIYGAKIVATTDAELYAQGVWSVSQWMGPNTNIAPGQQVDPNQWKSAFASVNFFDYLREKLATGDESADDATGDLLTSLCNDLKQRVPDVEAAGSLPLQARPATLPMNIYNADPVWEQLATPSRDGRTRQAIINLPGLIAQNFRNGVRRQFHITYAGSAASYQQAVLAKWNQMDASCKLTYKNSAGAPVTINFSQIIARAPRMSFDYADCVEKRWGAPDSEIAATCRDTDTGNRWYKAEQSLRNGGGKTNDAGVLTVRSDRPITLDMLESGRLTDQPDSAAVSLGFSRSQQPDVKAYLASPQFLNDLAK